MQVQSGNDLRRHGCHHRPGGRRGSKMVPVMQRIFVYGKETIPYSVLFSARRTLGIKVYPSGEVVLLAPERGRRRRSSSRNSTNGRRGFFGSRPVSRISGSGVRKNSMSAESPITIWRNSFCSGYPQARSTASATRAAASRWYALLRTRPGS